MFQLILAKQNLLLLYQRIVYLNMTGFLGLTLAFFAIAYRKMAKNLIQLQVKMTTNIHRQYLYQQPVFIRLHYSTMDNLMIARICKLFELSSSFVAS